MWPSERRSHPADVSWSALDILMNMMELVDEMEVMEMGRGVYMRWISYLGWLGQSCSAWSATEPG